METHSPDLVRDRRAWIGSIFTAAAAFTLSTWQCRMCAEKNRTLAVLCLEAIATLRRKSFFIVSFVGLANPVHPQSTSRFRKRSTGLINKVSRALTSSMVSTGWEISIEAFMPHSFITRTYLFPLLSSSFSFISANLPSYSPATFRFFSAPAWLRPVTWHNSAREESEGGRILKCSINMNSTKANTERKVVKAQRLTPNWGLLRRTRSSALWSFARGDNSTKNN